MGLIVQKFGGTSVANVECVERVAGIIADTYHAGNNVVAVVSAQGDTTDDLIRKAKEINPKASKREMDVLLSTGEQISMSLLAMAIQKMDLPVVSLTGAQAGMRTDIAYGNAKIERIDTERLESEIGKGKIVIIAGFQGTNRYDDITTLGRGGSDTTAVAFAAALNADLCQIYTDVDGVYTADPRIVPDAKKLDEISYDEMLELASLGAQVLHNRSVEMAKRYSVDMEVLSSFQKAQGTKVKEVVGVEKMLIRGVARDNHVARIAIIGLPDRPGTVFQIFSRLGKAKINVDVILQSIGRDGTKDVSFTVDESNTENAVSILKEILPSLGGRSITHDSNIAKVSIVGAGMATNPGVAAKMFEALYQAGINIQMISTSEIKVSVLIERDEADRAVKIVHNAFHFGS
ncbi:MAG TPA: aspartate kinase [Ruminococcaceae bacterium]|nr:aspartate kinase [Oscillospiraceae bacterium]